MPLSTEGYFFWVLDWVLDLLNLKDLVNLGLI